MTRVDVAKYCLIFVVVSIVMVLGVGCALAQPESFLELIDEPGSREAYVALEILAVLTLLSLAPALVITVTSFTRIIIVLSFLRSALGTQQLPPNQVIIGMALFLTFFVMAPVGQQINDLALQPYLAEEISLSEAATRGISPLRDFMFSFTREKDLEVFVELAGIGELWDQDDVPTHVLVPAFMISELRTAFQLGFLLFIPFLVIDIIVASTLMSMGMMMLPPVIISLPFKILLFVLADGWNLVIRSLLMTYQR
ncbi:MAG: flagellar type III secretion system pore protein FliP [Limnochordia bacterium]|jgi:flagellar biosynthetic protein FliP|nr:flagellar type III secretion system pore protein FliP [Limnochordia bacterium]MDD2629266.1 flagellar type III secretion system pore protein FliP [Limnochordia bacterium]MDD4517270.1 flagellar type III secretion system pore protein FliP [Limnochordia bacterium]